MKTIKCIVVVTLFGLGALSPAWAEDQATILGKITEKTGTPVIKAIVKIGDHFSFTDVKGMYRIKNVPFGIYTLIISKKEKVLKKIEVKIDQKKIEYDVVLK